MTRRSLGPPKRRLGSRLGRILLYVVAVLVVLAGVNIFLANRTSFPVAPELAKVSLELRGVAAPSAPLKALLGRRGRGFDRAQKALKGPLAAIRLGRWLRAPESIIEAIGAQHKPTLLDFQRALAAPGCLPEEPPLGTKGGGYRYLLLIRGARLSALRAIALAQTGRAPRAFTELGPIHDRLAQLQRECAPHLFGTIILDTALRWLLPAWGYLLALTDGGDDRAPAPGGVTASLGELQARVWPRLRALEAPVDGVMANALRHEHRFLAGYFERLRKHPEQRRKSDGPLVWPWFDAADTLRLQRILSARQVWLAQKPLADAAWRRTFPETTYLAEVRRGSMLSLFRYNQAGKVLLAIARPDFRRFHLKLVQTRCLAAAQRALWIAELKKRGQIVPATALAPAPRDPFTDQPFAALGAQVCGLPAALAFHGPLAVETLTPLPPTPPPTPSDRKSGD